MQVFEHRARASYFYRSCMTHIPPVIWQDAYPDLHSTIPILMNKTVELS
jgi:hypothetical protein